MKRFHLLWTAALIPLLAACNINLVPPTDFMETRTFDLASPVPFDALPFVVEVESFSNECSGRFKMVFREDSSQIEVDEYNRWSMPPGAMLTKYLAARFAAQSDNREREGRPLFVLDGTVLNCELDKPRKHVDLMVHFFIIQHDNDTFRITGTEDYSIPVEDTSAEAFANGMNKAAAKFADHIVAVLKDELKNRADAEKAAPESK